MPVSSDEEDGDDSVSAMSIHGDEICVKNELLVYAVHHFKNSSRSRILDVLIKFYRPSEVHGAKKDLMKYYGDIGLKDDIQRKRRNGMSKTKHVSEAEDILEIISEADRQKLLGKPRFYATNLDRIPKFSPEENDVTSVLARVMAMEAALVGMRDLEANNKVSIDRLDSEAVQQKMQISELMNGRYSAALRSTPDISAVQQKVSQQHSAPQAASTPVGSPSRQSGATRYGFEAAADLVVKLPPKKPGIHDEDGYEMQKRKNKKRKTQEGKNTSCNIKAVPRKKSVHVFVSRLAPDTSDEDFQKYMSTKLKFDECKRMSNEKAMFKSFRISIAKKTQDDNEYEEVLGKVLTAIPLHAECRFFRFPRRDNDDAINKSQDIHDG